MIVGLSSKSTQIDLTSQPANQPLSSQYHTNWPQRTTQYQEIGRKYFQTTHSLFSVELTRNWLNGHNITQVDNPICGNWSQICFSFRGTGA